jgi:hypothetical protein
MRILREETVSGMNGVDIADFCGTNDPINLQIAFRARRPPDTDRLICQLDVKRIDVSLGINGNRWNFQFFAGSNDPQRDLAAVGNQNFIKHDYFTRKSG